MTMPESSEAGTVRRLPGGDPRPVRIERRGLDLLELQWAGRDEGDSKGDGIEAGVLVEIEGERTLYFGQVLDCRADSPVRVAIEHFIDKQALAEIGEMWKTNGA